VNRARAAFAGLALIAATLLPAHNAEARGYCHVWLLHRGQPVACRAHTTVRPWAGFTHR
jgi:hypothetical protein